MLLVLLLRMLLLKTPAPPKLRSLIPVEASLVCAIISELRII